MYNLTTIGHGLGYTYPSKILAWGLGTGYLVAPPKYLISEYGVIIDMVLSHYADIDMSKQLTTKIIGDC